jgi:hypothetical protein
MCMPTNYASRQGTRGHRCTRTACNGGILLPPPKSAPAINARASALPVTFIRGCCAKTYCVGNNYVQGMEPKLLKNYGWNYLRLGLV